MYHSQQPSRKHFARHWRRDVHRSQRFHHTRSQLTEVDLQVRLESGGGARIITERMRLLQAAYRTRRFLTRARRQTRRVGAQQREQHVIETRDARVQNRIDSDRVAGERRVTGLT